MNILIVSNHFWPANFRVNDLAFGLRERGHRVTVMCGIPDYPLGRFFDGYGLFRRRTETVRGVKVLRIPLIPRGDGGKLRLILTYLSSTFFHLLYAPWIGRKRYDAIFVFDTSPVLIALPAVLIHKLYKTPIAMWILDLWPESISATGAITNKRVLGAVRMLVRMIYRNCERLLISSQGFVENIKSIGGYDGPITYFPNWVEQGMTDTPLPEHVTLPNLPEGFRIVFTGNIGVAQSFETVLDAAEKLSQHKDIHWVIIGDGRQTEWVQSEIERRRLGSQFHLLGRFPLEAMPWFFERADALLMPLRRDPIFALTAPGKLQSYLSSGKPILASLDGEGADIVRRAQAGLASPAGDPAALAESVLSLYQMAPEERAELGDNGRRYCQQHFNRDVLFDRLENLLHEIAPAADE